jgi:hypothetical protein
VPLRVNNNEFKKKMNIFRQVIDTEQIGAFLADATHENGIIQSLKIFPVRDGIIVDALEYTLTDLPDLAEKMQVHLTASLG